ncbi:BLUF domain-containing protein [Methylobacterium sp. WCS2018Hpa-22]|uniref:BLUF domain-containing protein n=1 Tax=Methylobacterium sp. WCS2018Hpa-22 TaxID=3073633 RepID=UPI00288B9F59|nr:BLUF domain-containing protein [Methylobacterium sp. WCS2018Hpa-22]
MLYVSRRRATDADIVNIVDAARARNARLQVTGALIATDARFAQILEGSQAAIDELMDSIRRDRRHEHVDVVQDRQTAKREFSIWSMAYSGRSVFAESLIGALATNGSDELDDRHLKRLQDFMREFARTSP